jgi:hypothetical protein
MPESWTSLPAEVVKMVESVTSSVLLRISPLSWTVALLSTSGNDSVEVAATTEKVFIIETKTKEKSVHWVLAKNKIDVLKHHR